MEKRESLIEIGGKIRGVIGGEKAILSRLENWKMWGGMEQAPYESLKGNLSRYIYTLETALKEIRKLY